MSSNGKKKRGRGGKTSLSRKYECLESDGHNSRGSTPNTSRSGTPSLRTPRGSSRGRNASSRKFVKHYVKNDSDFAYADEFHSDPDSEYENEKSRGNNYEEEAYSPPRNVGLDLPDPPSEHDSYEEDDYDQGGIVGVADVQDDEYSNDSYSQRSSWLSRRSPTPEIPDPGTIPELELPTSSKDLMIDKCNVMQALSVYEVLRQFSRLLRLSPFRFDDFCAALACSERSNLLSEVHIALMKAWLRDEDGNNTTFGPHDVKPSVEASAFFIDSMTWYEVLRQYLESHREREICGALRSLMKPCYETLPINNRLIILEKLVDMFLSCNTVRSNLIAEGNIQYDDHCRQCHRLGDLLCCETCSATFHLGCVDPPMEAVPESDWHCPLCVKHQVKGVYNPNSEFDAPSSCLRQDCLGTDRHNRRYWFMCRRLIVESDEGIWYYSSKAQLKEVLFRLDPEYWEARLVREIEYRKRSMKKAMDMTLELTNEFKGTRKTELGAELERLERSQTEREQRFIDGENQLDDRSLKNEDSASVVEEEGEQKTPCPSLHNGQEDVAEEPALPSDVLTEEEPAEASSVDEAKVLTGSEQNDDSSRLIKLSSARLAAKPGGADLKGKTMLVVNKDGTKTTIILQPKESTSEEADSGQDGPRATRSMTGTATQQPKHLQDCIVSKNASVHMTTKAALMEHHAKQSETVMVMDKDGKMSQVTRSTLSEERAIKRPDVTTTSNFMTSHTAYKLGMEGTYKQYVNYYTTETLALNKHQHNEARDKKVHLSRKFSLTPASEFKWNGSIHGTRAHTEATLRMTMTALESAVANIFMHTTWESNTRANWLKALNLCKTPADFALALAILENAIKPVLFNSIWGDNLGHVRLYRTTAANREEQKRLEKENKGNKSDDANADRSTWVKFTMFPKQVPHTVWKFKHEEYRITGGGGWYWIRSIRRSKGTSQDKVGLRALARKLARKPLVKVELKQEVKEEMMAEEGNVAAMEIDGTVVKQENKNDEQAKEKEKSSDDEDYAEMERCRLMHRITIDLKEGLQKFTIYPQIKNKPKAKLDKLLSLRVRLLQFEMQQKNMVSQVLTKFKKAFASASEKMKQAEAVAELPKKQQSFACYSAMCRSKASSHFSSCYSVSCCRDPDDLDYIPEQLPSGKQPQPEEEDDDVCVDDGDVSQASTDVGEPEEKIAKKTANLCANTKDLPANCTSSEVMAAIARKVNEAVKSKEVPITDDDIKEVNDCIEQAFNSERRVSLARIAKGTLREKRKKLNQATMVHRFFAPKKKDKHLFVLDAYDVSRLARRGGKVETPGWSYNAKVTNVNWPYPCPRPLYKTAWRYRTHTLTSLAAVSLQLRYLWAVLRWDDMAVKPAGTSSNVVTTEESITTKKVLKKRDVGRSKLRSEYLVQTIVVPLGMDDSSRDMDYTPIRSGLRKRKKEQLPTKREPTVTENWIREEDMELHEIRAFHERLLNASRKQQAAAAGVTSTSSVSNTVVATRMLNSDGKANSELKERLEEELRRQRSAMQAKRLAEQGGQNSPMSGVIKMVKMPSGGIQIIKTNVNAGTPNKVMISRQGGTPTAITQPAKIAIQNKQTSIATPTIKTSALLTSSPAAKIGTPGTPSQTTVQTLNMPRQLQNGQQAVQQVKIINGPNGLQVSGLLPNQKLVKMPDGRLQLITNGPKPATAVLPTAVTTAAPAASVATSNVALATPVASQTGTTSAITSALAAPQTPTAQGTMVAIKTAAGIQHLRLAPQTIVSSASPTIKASPATTTATSSTLATTTSGSTPQQSKIQAIRLPNGQIQLIQSMQGGQQSTVAQPTATQQSANIAVVQSNTPGGTSSKVMLASPPPGSNITQPTLIRTANGQHVLIRPTAPPARPLLGPNATLPPNAPGSVGASTTVKSADDVAPEQKTPMTSATAPAASTAAEADKKQVSSDVIQQMVATALGQNQDPDIQQKLLAMQRKMGSSKSTSVTPSATRVTSRGREVNYSQDYLDAVADAQPTSRRETPSTERRQVRVEPRSQKKMETAEQKAARMRSQKLNIVLTKHKDSLKRDIFKKRALLEKNLAAEIQVEIQEALAQVRDNRKRRLDQQELPAAVKKDTYIKRRSSSGEHDPLALVDYKPKKKKQKIISTGSMKNYDANEKLYCVCKQPYDDTRLMRHCNDILFKHLRRFYVGCDLCSNWYHGECIGVDEERAQYLDNYVCDECKRSQESANEELYCVCRTPYDESKFYIGCDNCQDWFHDTCVGITKAEAEHIDTYICPNCRISAGSDAAADSERRLYDAQYEELYKLVKQLKVHKMAWPFQQPVDRRQVPQYYDIIKDPMDLRTMEIKLMNRSYLNLGEYMKDASRIFDNCRLFNPPDSSFFRCADVLEAYFTQQVKLLKADNKL